MTMEVYRRPALDPHLVSSLWVPNTTDSFEISDFWLISGVLISEFLDFWVSGFLNFWLLANFWLSDFWISGFLNFWLLKFLTFGWLLASPISTTLLSTSVSEEWGAFKKFLKKMIEPCTGHPDVFRFMKREANQPKLGDRFELILPKASRRQMGWYRCVRRTSSTVHIANMYYLDVVTNSTPEIVSLIATYK